MKKISLYNKNKLEKTNLLIDAEGRYEEQKKRLHDALSTVIEVEKMYEELKEDYEELKEQMKKTVPVKKYTKLLRDNRIQVAESNWLDALVTYFRDGQHEEDKEAVNELQDDFYRVRKEVARLNKADNITSEKVL